MPRSRLPRRAPVAALLLVLAILPTVLAQVPEGRNEVRLAVIEYHPYPDPFLPGDSLHDPFGFWAINDSRNVPRDWMSGYYDARTFPTARFDGVGLVANSANSDPRNVEEDYRREFEARLAQDSPFILNVSGKLNATDAILTVKVVNRGAEADGLVLRGALFTDDVPYDAPNQVENHRFMARARFNDTPLRIPVGASETFPLTLTLPRDIDGAALPRDRMGVVVYVQNLHEEGRFKEDEVLQSAVYYFGQDGPTVQSVKAVLIELYTATWCDACLYGDTAVDALAEEHGVPTTFNAGRVWRYFTGPPGALALVGALGTGALAAAFLVPLARRPREGGDRK